jgi:hypothetical protein
MLADKGFKRFSRYSAGRESGVVPEGHEFKQPVF